MASPVAVVGDKIEGVTILSTNRGIPLQTTTVNVYTSLKPIVHGDALPAHAPFTDLHNVPVAQSTTTTVIIQGKKVVRVGVDAANCGHTITQVSSGTVIAGP